MINIHLNGDIVRCPNIADILERDREIKYQHKICHYNIHQSDCDTYIHDQAEWKDEFDPEPRCKLAGCLNCPGHRKQVELGKQKKTFKIDNAIYRKLASSAHYMVKESKSKTLFFTLTFPQFKRKFRYNEINECFSRFAENLRSNYGCTGYIAVREFGKNTHRVHFHMLCAIPFVSFITLNRVWCNSISDISEYSGRALYTDPKTRFITNPQRAMRYVCKYFAKAKNQVSETRLVFLSNTVLQKAKSMDAPLESVLDSFKFDWMRQTSDFTTCYKITDWNEFNRFCDQFLYPFFELSTKKPPGLTNFNVYLS